MASGEQQRAELEKKLNANIFFDECECYFERPVDGGLEDAIEFLAGFETEVRLAAIAFAEKYAEAAYSLGWDTAQTTNIPLLNPELSVGENYDLLWARYVKESK